MKHQVCVLKGSMGLLTTSLHFFECVTTTTTTTTKTTTTPPPRPRPFPPPPPPPRNLYCQASNASSNSDWECEFCGRVFPTFTSAEHHERVCVHNTRNTRAANGATTTGSGSGKPLTPIRHASMDEAAEAAEEAREAAKEAAKVAAPAEAPAAPLLLVEAPDATSYDNGSGNLTEDLEAMAKQVEQEGTTDTSAVTVATHNGASAAAALTAAAAYFRDAEEEDRVEEAAQQKSLGGMAACPGCALL